MMSSNPEPKHPTLVQAMNDAVRFRALLVVGFIGFTMLFNVLRLAISPDQGFSDEPVIIPIAMTTFLVYQTLTLVWLYRWHDDSQPIPPFWIYTNAVIEASLPTLLCILITITGVVSLEQVALGPLSQMYALFIVLSILHIRLRVCLTAGLISAAGLAGLFGWIGYTNSVSGDTVIIAPSLGLFSAVLVLCAGAAAGLVASRTRQYLETAVAEAESRVRAEQDLQAAALIQQGLMPREKPQIPGFEVVGWNRPAEETGGDYYDWIKLEDGRFAICIADVTGHGLGPAMITCFCRAYARTALRLENRVIGAMQRLNSELAEDLGSGRFVTFASVIVTPNEKKLVTVSAGHGPILLYRRAGKDVESYNADALPLGVVETMEDFEATKHELSDGDLMLFITDGFFEWANPAGQQFGTKRLKASLSEHGDKEPSSIIQAILSDVEAFSSGTPQPDDLTAVVIQCVSPT